MRRRELPSCYSIEALAITEEEGAVALPLCEKAASPKSLCTPTGSQRKPLIESNDPNVKPHILDKEKP